MTLRRLRIVQKPSGFYWLEKRSLFLLWDVVFSDQDLGKVREFARRLRSGEPADKFVEYV